MVVHCVVVGCTKYFRKKPVLRFSRLPSECGSEKRAKWIAAVRRERWKPEKSTIQITSTTSPIPTMFPTVYKRTIFYEAGEKEDVYIYICLSFISIQHEKG